MNLNIIIKAAQIAYKGAIVVSTLNSAYRTIRPSRYRLDGNPDLRFDKTPKQANSKIK